MVDLVPNLKLSELSPILIRYGLPEQKRKLKALDALKTKLSAEVLKAEILQCEGARTLYKLISSPQDWVPQIVESVVQGSEIVQFQAELLNLTLNYLGENGKKANCIDLNALDWTDKKLKAPASKELATTGGKLEIETETIEAPLSVINGKRAFLNTSGKECSTEEFAVDYLLNQGWQAIYTEVRFWEAVFALALWEEIFESPSSFDKINDIPTDLFSGSVFFKSRQDKIEKKLNLLASAKMGDYLRIQLRQYGKYWTRILYGFPKGDFSYGEFLKSDSVYEFLQLFPTSQCLMIVSRLAQDFNKNRSGLPDLVAWKAGQYQFVEVKKVKEGVRPGQTAWLSWLSESKIPCKIIRVKGVSASNSEKAAA